MIDLSSERRKFARAETSIPIQYKNLKNSEIGVIGTLSQSISEGGTRFFANEFLPLATRLIIEIMLPSLPRPVKALSKVAWVRKISTQDKYEVGNQFLDITKEDKKHIANFVTTTTTLGTL